MTIMTTPGTLYTIGYQALDPQRLAALAQHLQATVIDCRASPVSRIKGFGHRQLAELLGARYEREIEPGEVLVLGARASRSLFPREPVQAKPCVF